MRSLREVGLGPGGGSCALSGSRKRKQTLLLTSASCPGVRLWGTASCSPECRVERCVDTPLGSIQDPPELPGLCCLFAREREAASQGQDLVRVPSIRGAEWPEPVFSEDPCLDFVPAAVRDSAGLSGGSPSSPSGWTRLSARIQNIDPTQLGGPGHLSPLGVLSWGQSTSRMCQHFEEILFHRKV